MNRRRAKISMYLRARQIWWAYLAVRSNPAIGRLINACDHLIIFDDPDNVPAPSAGTDLQYLMVFWDGLIDDGFCKAASRSLGTQDIKFFAVGDYSAVAGGLIDIQPLYAEGPLRFHTDPLRFDWKTTVLLLAARLKALLMPLKNIFGRLSRTREGIEVLFGRKRIVFCGSLGITPQLIDMLCKRHSVDLGLFVDHEYFSDVPRPSLERYRSYLRNEGLIFAGLYEKNKIKAPFFLSCMQLLGRGYLLERIRDAGLPLYANSFAGESFVDVYSTPFYSQHVFLDFGSVAGSGNYPRLVDLRYFQKTTVEMKLTKELEPLLIGAQSGSLESIFEKEWEAKAPQLIQVMK